ncbi:hypothetical protein LIA77_07621 [Sarocladium implicatum]|nr:hypothetical protein LIA77_07621 [Sarocladium implicatum]
MRDPSTLLPNDALRLLPSVRTSEYAAAASVFVHQHLRDRDASPWGLVEVPQWTLETQRGSAPATSLHWIGASGRSQPSNASSASQIVHTRSARGFRVPIHTGGFHTPSTPSTPSADGPVLAS